MPGDANKVGSPAKHHRRRRAGISAYLAGTFGLTVLILAVALSATTYTTYSRQRRDALAQLSDMASTQASKVATSLSSTTDFLRTTVQSPDIASLDPARCTSALRALAQETAGTGVVAVVDDSLHVLCASDPKLSALGRLTGLDDFVAKILATGAPAYEAGAQLLAHSPGVVLGGAVTGPSGARAALVASLPFAEVDGAPSSPLPNGMVFAELSNDRSTILDRSPGADKYAATLDLGTGISKPLPGGSATVVDVDGVRRVYREASVGPTGWRVLIGQTPAQAFGRAEGDLKRNASLALLTVGVVLLLGLLLYRHLARPVQRLREAIEAAGSNDDVRAELAGPAEIAALSEAFNATFAERKELERQLAHRALHDPLTDLPNRALLADRLGQALRQRDRGLIGVYFLDLDRFKLINDAHGHPAGDRLLVALGRRLAAAMRPGDTVARFGGDEFVVLADIKDREEAALIASRLTAALAAPFELDGREVYLSGTVGVALGVGGEEPHELIRSADAAMYRAKDDNKGGFAIYDEGMHLGALARLDTERELHRALAENELVLHYQPKISLTSGAMEGVEALVRWSHPLRGLVSPAEFVPVAEETGQIVAIGEWVLTEACRQAVSWHAEGKPTTVSINLSARQLAQDDLVDRVAHIINETGARAEWIFLEVTEGSLLGDARAAAERLGALRAVGVKVSIDDFGTGYSSLAYLRTLPLDEIKIDRSFVTELPRDLSAEAIVASIVTLGHALGLSVIAEGVETAEQLGILRALGCDLAQGYYLNRPAPPERLAPVLFHPGAHPVAGPVAYPAAHPVAHPVGEPTSHPVAAPLAETREEAV